MILFFVKRNEGVIKMEEGEMLKIIVQDKYF
jgi:hypothetical protein